MKFYLLSAILSLSLVFAACNKDDVIEPDAAGDGRRPATSASSPFQSMVYEYTPAPGQFINDRKSGFTGEETTPAAACAYAMERLKDEAYVSLGAFGGFIVIGFDHSIVNSHGSYDFLIEGNAFNDSQGGSNEPGIVWVMQDANANGLPDDTWYELVGSESSSQSTQRDYAVTYYRPEPRAAVQWSDSFGNKGIVDYLPAFHDQESYYPGWIAADNFTLTGTCLASQNTEDASTGIWSNVAYGWGYADNMGSDCISLSLSGQFNGFKIANAVDKAGNAVNLEYIDFVKVQSAVLANSGHLGEISCEVLRFIDYALLLSI